jgi:Secretion system C-terminal sorting domain
MYFTGRIHLGESDWTDYYTFSTKNSTGIGSVKILPKKFELMQNYPNPFNPITTIKYSLPTSVKVELKIFDALGRKVTTLVNAKQLAGSYAIQVKLPKIASGVYFYKITAGKFQQVKKMLLIK